LNYTELVAAIQRYTEEDFAYLTDPSLVNTFIKQAEQRIYNTVQLANLRKTFTGALVAGNPVLNAPTDFLSPYSLAVVKGNGEYLYLLNKDVNFLREVFPNPASTALPRYYAINGPAVGQPAELAFLIGPTPDAAYAVELNYYFYPETIVTAGTTWLGDNFSSALLYGSLVEAYTYMKGEAELLGVYDAKYKEALAMLKNLGDGKQRGDAYRDGQIKLPAQ